MSREVKLISIIKGKRERRKWHPLLIKELGKIGPLTLIDNGETLSKNEILSELRKHDIIVTSHANVRLPKELADEPGRVRYVCHLHGTVREFIPREIIASPDILVSNWGNAPAFGVAEGAVTLTLAALKDMHKRIVNLREGNWTISREENGGSLYNLKIGIFGAGFIGRKYIELIRPFEPQITVYDPFVKDIPEGCKRADSLEELFSSSRLVAVHAGLTPETEGIISAEILALMPRGSVLINTARGKIVNQEALFKEVMSGRLRAGADVFETDEPLPAAHPIRQCEDMIFTTHSIAMEWPLYGEDPTELNRYDRICLDNIGLFLEGKSLDPMYVMDKARYDLST